MFGATVIVPSAFIVRLPDVGVGAVPGVSVTFALPLVTLAAVVPTVSLPSTLGVAPPATEPTGPNVSFTASMIGGLTGVAIALGALPVLELAVPPTLPAVVVFVPPPCVSGAVYANVHTTL